MRPCRESSPALIGHAGTPQGSVLCLPHTHPFPSITPREHMLMTLEQLGSTRQHAHKKNLPPISQGGSNRRRGREVNSPPVARFLISSGQRLSSPLTHRCALALKLEKRPSAGGGSSGARRQHITTPPRRHLRRQTTQGGRWCYEGLTRPGHHLFALLP